MKISIEGEGDLIGIRTVFFDYPSEKHLLQDQDDWKSKVAAVYVNADQIDFDLIQALVLSDLRSTIECSFDVYDRQALNHPSVRYFVDCDEYRRILASVWVKIQIFTANEKEWKQKIEIANKFAKDGHPVMLMPVYIAENFVDLYLKYRDLVNPHIRYAPPLQDLIGMD